MSEPFLDPVPARREDGDMAAVRAAVFKALRDEPTPRRWWVDAGGLVLVSVLVAGGSVIGASTLFGAPTRVRESSVLVAFAILTGIIAAVRPPGRGRTGVAAVTVLAAMVSAALCASAQRHVLTIVGEVDCAFVELGASVLPALATLGVLRRFSFSPHGSMLGGLAVGMVGVLTLDLTCPVGTAGHVAVYHLAPSVLVAAALVVARSRSSSRSYAP